MKSDQHKEKTMKTRLMMTTSALIAALFCLPAIAQTGPGMGGGPGMNGMGSGMQQGGRGMQQQGGQGMGQKGPGASGPRDCSQAQKPATHTAKLAPKPMKPVKAKLARSVNNA
jgi:hypothetical protein